MGSARIIPEILLVDDVPANLVAMQRILKNSDVNIIKSSGGYEALELTMKHDFALVLMDVHMPEIDGYETTEMLKSTEHSKNLPVIFVTANLEDEENVLKGYAVGAVDYISKPVSAEILRKKVNVFVELYRQRKELEQLNRKLLETQEKAEQSSRLKSNFLANITHELRTPMHAIIGFCDIGKMNIAEWSKDEQLENLEEIKDSGTRLLSLINDLLDLSKLESSNVDFDFRESDLKDIANTVAKSLRSLVEDKNLRLIIDGRPQKVYCDKAKILQVMTNFLSNAIKFSPPGRNILLSFDASLPPETVEYAVKPGEESVFFSVIDEGVGVPRAELITVFDKFIQSSKTKTDAGGTGLGLAICKEIIEGHGGTIWAENALNGGAKFTFSIPRMQHMTEVGCG